MHTGRHVCSSYHYHTIIILFTFTFTIYRFWQIYILLFYYSPYLCGFSIILYLTVIADITTTAAAFFSLFVVVVMIMMIVLVVVCYTLVTISRCVCFSHLLSELLFYYDALLTAP